MTGWSRFKPPSPDDGAAGDAEQCWLAAEAEIGRQIMYAAICLVADLVASAFAAICGHHALLQLLFIGCLGVMARVIFLIIKRDRTFMAIKIAGGMTKKEALLENLSRYSG